MGQIDLITGRILSYENVEDKSKTLLHPKNITYDGWKRFSWLHIAAIEALEWQDIDVR